MTCMQKYLLYTTFSQNMFYSSDYVAWSVAVRYLSKGAEV